LLEINLLLENKRVATDVHDSGIFAVVGDTIDPIRAQNDFVVALDREEIFLKSPNVFFEVTFLVPNTIRQQDRVYMPSIWSDEGVHTLIEFAELVSHINMTYGDMSHHAPHLVQHLLNSSILLAIRTFSEC
jgi:hypothetical protein